MGKCGCVLGNRFKVILGERMSSGSGVWRRVGRWDLRVWIAEFLFCFVRIVEREGGRGNKYFGRGLCCVRMGVCGLLMMIGRVVVRGLVCSRQSRRVDGGGGGGLGTCGALM